MFSNVNTIWNIIYLKYIREMRNNLSYFSIECIKIGNESHSERFNAREALAAPCARLFPRAVAALVPFL